MSSAGPPPDPAAAAAAAAAAQAAMHQFTVEAFTLLGVGIAVTTFRTYARMRNVGIKGLQWDDFLVWVGVLAYAAETCLAYSVGNVAHGLANNGMTDEQRAALSPDDPEYTLRVIGSKIQLGGWSSYTILLWSLKASLLVLYLRLTAGLGRWYRIRIYIGFVFLLLSFIVIILNLFLSCRPFHKMWQIYPNPGEVCQPAISNQIVWMYWSMNVTTDLYLISIPVPMLWQSSLKPVKKIGLMLLFSTGLLVVACATLRCVLIVTDPINGAQLAGSWAVRETFVAVVTTNLPMIFPLLKVWLTPLLGSLMTSLTSRYASQKIDSNIKGSKTFGSTQSWGRRCGPPTANPITNMTFSESEERIVGGLKLQELQNNWSDSTATPENVPTPANGKSIRKHVQVSVTHSDRPEGEMPPRKSITGDDNQPSPEEHGSYAFARGPDRGSFHFGGPSHS